MEKLRTMQDWCQAEIAIYEAMQEVEKMPPDVRLTDAVNLLNSARAKVAEYVTLPTPPEDGK